MAGKALVQMYWPEINAWRDQDGLIGNEPHPAKWSTGNPLLETGIAMMLGRLIGAPLDLETQTSFRDAFKRCEIEPGLFNKNPGRNDELSHDEIIGVAAGSWAMSLQFHYDVCHYGITHSWRFQNTPKWFYTAESKPWNIAFYMLRAGCNPGIFSELVLAGFILSNIFSKDASGSRLVLVMLNTIKGLSSYIDMAGIIWSAVMTKRYGDVGGLMSAYYGTIDHIFVRWGKGISFPLL